MKMKVIHLVKFDQQTEMVRYKMIGRGSKGEMPYKFELFHGKTTKKYPIKATSKRMIVAVVRVFITVPTESVIFGRFSKNKRIF